MILLIHRKPEAASHLLEKHMELGLPELLIILVLIILLFGVGRISKLGKELGSGIRAFREGLRGEEPTETVTQDRPVESFPLHPGPTHPAG